MFVILLMSICVTVPYAQYINLYMPEVVCVFFVVATNRSDGFMHLMRMLSATKL